MWVGREKVGHGQCKTYLVTLLEQMTDACVWCVGCNCSRQFILIIQC